MTTRRKHIQDLIGQGFRPSSPNISLWLDKYTYNSKKDGKSEASTFDDSKKEETSKSELVRRVTSITEPAIYKTYFQNTWKPSLDNFKAKYREAKVKNRLAINLGSESVLETNIALHRVFGVPFIAGSSLKGMTAAFLRHYGGIDWQKNKQYYITVFGDENNAGFITFYDALYIPETGFPDKNGVKRPLYADIMTTHHQDYYGEKKENGEILPPADWDSPNPVPFISATGEYLIALSGPTDWVELTFDILGFALATEGIGAKTSSGYGRMWLKDENNQITDKYELKESTQPTSNSASNPPVNQLSEAERIAQSLILRVNALRENDVANQIKNFADQCFEIEDNSARQQVAQVIRQKVIDANREKKSSEKKWYQDIIKISEDAEWIVTPK